MDLNKYPKNLDGLPVIPKKDYYATHPDFRGVWTTERDDLPNWAADRANYMGKRTLMVPGPALVIEDMHFVIGG